MAKILFTNNATTTLFVTIDSSETEITVAPGTGPLFPTISQSKDEYFLVTLISSSGDFEIVKVIARVDDRFTVERAQEGTTAKSFEQGSVVELRLTAGGIMWIASRVAAIENSIGYVDDSSSVAPSDYFIDSIINHPRFKHASKHATTGTDPISPTSIGAASGDATGNAINANQWGGSAIFRSSSVPSTSVGKINDVWFQWI